MNYVMGNFETSSAGNTSTIATPETVVSTGINLVTGSFEKSFENISTIAKNKQIQAFIEENNLSPYLRDVTKENVKTILALLGLYSVYRFVKSPVGIALLAGTAIYVMSKTDISKLTEKMTSTALAKAPDTKQENIIKDNSGNEAVAV